MTTIESTNNENSAASAEQAGQGAPEPKTAKKGATPRKRAPKGRRPAKEAKVLKTAKKAKTGKKAAAEAKKPSPASQKKASAPRGESKGAMILSMITRVKGATLAEIMEAAQWQSHSVRGFISTAGKKHGIQIESAKTEAGDRVYKLAK